EHSQHSKRLLIGVVAACTTLLAWTIAPLMIRSFREVVGPHTNNAARYCVGAMLWVPLLISALWTRKITFATFRRATPAIVWNVAGQVCFVMSFYAIDPGLITFGLRAQIVAVAIFAPLLFPSERRVMRSAGFIIGLAMVLTGVLAMAVLSVKDATGHETLQGILLAVTAGVGYAGYGLSVRKFLDGVPHTHSFAMISVATAIAMVVVMLIAGPQANSVGEMLPWAHQIFTQLPLKQLGLLALAGVIGIGVSHVLFYFAMERLGVAVSTGVIQIQPVLVYSGSAIFYQERLTPLQLAFGVVAISGAILLVTAQHRIAKRDRQIHELAGQCEVAEVYSDEPIELAKPEEVPMLAAESPSTGENKDERAVPS
ncbi:MAG: DMT family transporter, partial [Planctomycetota bacterium]